MRNFNYKGNENIKFFQFKHFIFIRVKKVADRGQPRGFKKVTYLVLKINFKWNHLIVA